MPRLLKYTTQGLVDNVPDSALQVIEHTSLFYLVDRNFKGNNKYVAFAVLGSLYEYGIFQLKQADPETKPTLSGKK